MSEYMLSPQDDIDQSYNDGYSEGMHHERHHGEAVKLLREYDPIHKSHVIEWEKRVCAFLASLDAETKNEKT